MEASGNGNTLGGRELGVEHNGVFTAANTDPIAGGRLWPEAALTWNAMHAAFVADGGDPDHFRPGGPASSARSIAQQEHFYANQPPPAARPGTSNHGWGVAVDIPFADAQAWLRRHAYRWGWSDEEGRRVGEPWHWTYRGAAKARLARLRLDALDGYTPSETRWIREYDRLVAHGWDPDRRRVLRRVMTEARKRIWRAAQDEKGWTPLRTRRYNSLRARTT